jgi:hypothetical protein
MITKFWKISIDHKCVNFHMKPLVSVFKRSRGLAAGTKCTELTQMCRTASICRMSRRRTPYLRRIPERSINKIKLCRQNRHWELPFTLHGRHRKGNIPLYSSNTFSNFGPSIGYPDCPQSFQENGGVVGLTQIRSGPLSFALFYRPLSANYLSIGRNVSNLS